MRFCRDIMRYRKYIIFDVRAKLRAEVSNSYLDWLWWVLEPLGLMLIYVFIFEKVFQSGEQYFPLFIFSGNAMWTFFSRSVAESVRMIRTNQTIITKVYIPKYIFLIISMMINAYKMLVSFGIVLAMIIVFRVQLSWRVVLLIPVMLVFFLFTFGVAMLCMHGGVLIGDLSYIIHIGLNMLMYLSGIFYSMDRFDPPFNQIIGVGNPVAFLITSMRDVVMYHQNPDMLILLVWGILSLLLCMAGIRIIYKNENNYVKVM